jgi:peptide chain release factor subunit 1
MTTLDDAVIHRIASWGTDTVATSLYLDVDGLRHPRWPDVERRADHLFRSARERARREATGTEAEVEADLTAIRTWLDRGLDRSTTRGVALFSCVAKGLFETVQLTQPVRDQVVVDSEPDVAQLCMAIATSQSAIGLAVDKERWRVVRLERDGEVRELDVLDDTVPRNVDIDIELAGFERHEAELAHEHFRRVARAVTAEMVRQPARYLVLFGTGDSVAQLETYLPRLVADRIAARMPLPGNLRTSELVAAARETVELAEQERRSAVLVTLRERATSTGTSVVTGLDATLEALGGEQVQTLVVERTFEAPGGRCEDCLLLVVDAIAQFGGCPRCGGRVRAIENVVDAAIAHAFLRHAALEPVDDGSLHDLGRIGALVHRWAATTTGGVGGA